jgi:hypothetical protein
MVVAGWGPIILQGGLRVFPCHWIHTCYGIAATAAHWAARVLPTEATSSTRSARHIRCVRTGRWCLRLRWWWWCRLLRWRQYGSLWCCRPIPIHHLLPISGAVAATAAYLCARVLPTEATSSTRSARPVQQIRLRRWCVLMWWWCWRLRWRRYGGLWRCRPIPIHHLLPISGAVAATAAY